MKVVKKQLHNVTNPNPLKCMQLLKEKDITDNAVTVVVHTALQAKVLPPDIMPTD